MTNNGWGIASISSIILLYRDILLLSPPSLFFYIWTFQSVIELKYGHLPKENR